MNIETLRDFCLSLPAVTEDFPFDESVLVFRVGGKIFILTNVDEGRTFNAKCDPEQAIELRERYPDAIQPGYHMNKQHWNTISMEYGLDEAMLRELIQHSYQLIWASLPKAKRPAL